MSPDDVERYRRDGYLVLKKQIPLAALKACLEEVCAVFNGMARQWSPSTPEAHDLTSLTRVMTAIFECDPALFMAAGKLAQHTIALHRLGCDEAMLGPLREAGLQMPAISTRPVIFIIHDALKVPGGYHKSPPHQDWRSMQGSLDSAVVWVPFADVAPGGHALEVLPGSHLCGLLPTDDDVFGHRVDEAFLPDRPFAPLQLELGDAVLFSSFTVHRTGEAGGEVARLAASYRYNNVLEPSFVERGYPNPYIYRPDMTLLTPAFPEPGLLAALFGPDQKVAAE
jgi:hypothetical protein